MSILTRHSNDSGFIISSYKEGALQVGNNTFSSPVLISSDELVENWAQNSLAELVIKDFALALEWEPEILLFGSGVTLQFPDFKIIRELRACNISLEVMDTAAAARTFNVLRSEGRHVIAALLL